MTKAGLFIFIVEMVSIHRLFRKYFDDTNGATVEEFIARATFEDVLRLTIHQRAGFFALCLMTMGKLFNV